MTKDSSQKLRFSSEAGMLLNDAYCVLGISAVTGFCFELVWPGFIGSRINLTALIILAVAAAFVVNAVSRADVFADRVSARYTFAFLSLDALLLAYFVSLQFTSVMLAFAVPSLIFISLLLSLHSVYDRRSRH